MKKLRIISLFVFVMIIALPMLKFNFKEDSVSDIDNRVLTSNPFKNRKEYDTLTTDIDNYLQDRIGGRTKMISAYQMANDKLFDIMEHPTYSYGKNDYVFMKLDADIKYNDYHKDFENFVVKMKDYCSSRNLPFRFMVEPSKTSILTDKLPDGYTYNNDWIFTLLNNLENQGVECVDNITYLNKLNDQGINIFNKQYNAGHWNDNGALYGVNNLITSLKTDYSNLTLNSPEEFNITKVKRDSLPVSKFKISEYEDVYDYKGDIFDIGDQFTDEISINQNYHNFGYYINEDKSNKNLPRVLIFQGSYMNGMGYKFMANAFNEYIFVHDYQNVLNFDYYINLFQPDCVIFETAEYTFKNNYYSQELMKNSVYNPPLDSLDGTATINIDKNELAMEDTSHFTVIKTQLIPQPSQYAYLKVGNDIYDMRKADDCFTVTIPITNLCDTDNVSLIYK